MEVSQRRFGRLGKGLLTLGVVFALAISVVVTAVLVDRHRKVAATRALLAHHADGVRMLVAYRDMASVRPKLTPDYYTLDGQSVVRWVQRDKNHREPLYDSWGRLLVFRWPGPVHPHGWDVYSFGPNGIDERGGGDDILVGEDVAEVTSAQ